LKRVLAGQFEHMDSMMEALEGPDGSTIIAERNKVALETLKEQIAAGKLKIGIFYGAGHMPDMERRLIDDLQELSRAEAGQIPLTLAAIAPAAIARAALGRLAEPFAEKGLSLVADLPADLPLVRADRDRAVASLILTQASFAVERSLAAWLAERHIELAK